MTVQLAPERLLEPWTYRGQLSVYLRELDVALPPIFGPTADET